MQRRAVLAGVAVGLAGCAGGDTDGGDSPDDSVTAPEREAAEAAIVEGINEIRSEEHAGTIGVDEPLRDAARAHSRDMAERGFYAHQNPDGEEPWDRVLCDAGENIHRGEIGRMQNEGGDETWQTRHADELAGYVVEGWVISDDHYRLMIDGTWRAMGVGVAIVDGEFFATAKFC